MVTPYLQLNPPPLATPSLHIRDVKEQFYSHEIVLLVANINYTIIYLQCGKVIVSSKNLKKYEAMLCGLGFVRIHKSTIVNPVFLDNRTPTTLNEVKMLNGKVVRMSRRRRKDIFQENKPADKSSIN